MRPSEARPLPPRTAPTATARAAHAAAAPAQDVLVMPGQLWFGRAAEHKVRTLLGSCVAVTLWHPRLRVGGMCHYLLPQRQRPAGHPRDGRYGEEAVDMLIEALQRSGAPAADFECHLYGGADTLPDKAGVKFNIGERNIALGWDLIDRHGLQLQGVDVGDNVPRTVTLDLRSGAVDCRRGQPHS